MGNNLLSSAINLGNKSIDCIANNIVKSNSNFTKEGTFHNLYSKAGGSSSINYVEEKSINIQGEVENSQISTNIAIQGNGFFPVSEEKDNNNSVVHTRNGEFSLNKEGYISNSANQILLGKKILQGGEPENKGINTKNIQGLEQVIINQDEIYPPKASDTINIVSANLSTDTNSIKGVGITLHLSENNDIILPSFDNNGELTIGDSLTISKDNSVRSTMTYGGIAMSKSIGNNSKIFGASKVDEHFNDPRISDNDGLRLSIDGNEYKFFYKAENANEETGDNYFYSLGTLTSLINNIPGVKAIINNSRLYVVAQDPNKGLSFSNIGGNMNCIKEELLLFDVKEPSEGEIRFNSIKSLEDQINKGQNKFLELKKESKNKVIINAKSAVDNLSITGTSYRQRQINYIKQLEMSDASNNKKQLTVAIFAPHHNLAQFDLVYISGVGSSLQDGFYLVSAINEDYFTVNFLNENTNDQFFDVTNKQIKSLSLTNQYEGNGFWRKACSKALLGNDDIYAVSSKVQISTSEHDIIINANGHNLSQNDIVYINYDNTTGVIKADNNFYVLPAGCYTVKSTNEGSFTINALEHFLAGEASSSSPLTIFPIAATELIENKWEAQLEGLRYKKIGINENNKIQVEIFETNEGSEEVILYLGSHNYEKGDVVEFSDLPQNYNIAGLKIENGLHYIITFVDKAKGLIKFIPENGKLATNSLVASSKSNEVGHNFKVNRFSRLYDYFNLNRSQVLYNQLYNPDVVGKRLLDLETKNNKDKGSIFSHTLDLVDSLGCQFHISLYFGKLAKNKWAVEIYNQDNILLQSGRLNFNSNGHVIDYVGLGNDLSVAHNNGSDKSSIKIDWITKNFTQYNSESSINMDNNGYSTGSFQKCTIDNTGIVTAYYTNGETSQLYQLLLGLCNNINQLEEVRNNSYIESKYSGPIKYEKPGVGSNGVIIESSIEKSTVDDSANLIKMQDRVIFQNIIYKAKNMENEVKSNAISAVK